MRTRTAIAVAMSMALASCAHDPKVVYAKVSPDAADWASDGYRFEAGPVRFKLAASVVAVTASSPASGAVAANARTVLDSLNQPRKPVADLVALEAAQPIATVLKVPGKTLYALYADDPFYFRSNLSPQYVPDTFLLSSLGAAAEDNSGTAIQSAGSLISTAVTLFSLAAFKVTILPAPAPVPPAKPLQLPLVVDLSAGSAGLACWNVPGDGSRYRWCDVPDAGDWQYAVVVQEPAVGAITSEAFFGRARSDAAYQRLFPVPACVSIALLLRKGTPRGDEKIEYHRFDLVVSDPSLVYGVRIPAKGSISMPDACGSNLTVNASGSPSALDDASALIQQVAAIRKAGTPASGASAASAPSN